MKLLKSEHFREIRTRKTQGLQRAGNAETCTSWLTGADELARILTIEIIVEQEAASPGLAG